jgi:hypothetical protein
VASSSDFVWSKCDKRPVSSKGLNLSDVLCCKPKKSAITFNACDVIAKWKSYQQYGWPFYFLNFK